MLPDGAWHLAHGIYAGVKHGRGLEPHAWGPIYFGDEIGTVDEIRGTVTWSKPKHASDGFWPRTSSSLALAIRETETIQRADAYAAKRGWTR